MTDEPTVRTTAGAVRGEWVDGAARFLGIPYAEPPAGKLRFQSPVPRQPWEGVFDARVYGATAQRKSSAESTIPEPSVPGEDILTVNVFTPSPGDLGAGHPVLVWIHGGGYVAGSPASPWYDGRSFSRDEVVTVTVGYRLGFDGFGWLPDAPQNRGVRDWVLALEWVRDNIAEFGGDPARVTIAGQSAGGGAIMTLLTLPAAEGLFSQAVSASGVPADISLDNAKSKAEEIASRLGIPLTAAAFAAVPEAELIAAQEPGFEGGELSNLGEVLAVIGGLNGTLALGPVVDGDYVIDTVENGIAAGRGSGIPLIIGATHDEFGGAFTAIREGVDLIPARDVLSHMGVDDAIIDNYVASLPDHSSAQIAAQFITDVMFRARLIDWMRLRRGTPTWTYDFTWRSAVSGLAEHCIDVPFIFDVLEAEGVARVLGQEPPTTLADAVHGAWVKFIESGDPGWGADQVTILDITARTGDTMLGARVIAAAVRV